MAALLHTAGGHACPICAGECTGTPDLQLAANYPFLGGGIDEMADQEYVIATERVDDPELERAVYGVGDRVPMADAIKYGLVPGPAKKRAAAKQAAPAKRARKGPAEDRAKRSGRNR